MSKTKKVMEVTIKDTTYVVIKDNTARYNPYKVYRKWYGETRSGYGMSSHRTKVTEYADLGSVFYFMVDACKAPSGLLIVTDGVWEMH